jgi:hypothetical protein
MHARTFRALMLLNVQFPISDSQESRFLTFVVVRALFVPFFEIPIVHFSDLYLLFHFVSASSCYLTRCIPRAVLIEFSVAALSAIYNDKFEQKPRQ